jgi:hypothetical protein
MGGEPGVHDQDSPRCLHAEPGMAKISDLHSFELTPLHSFSIPCAQGRHEAPGIALGTSWLGEGNCPAVIRCLERSQKEYMYVEGGVAGVVQVHSVFGIGVDCAGRDNLAEIVDSDRGSDDQVGVWWDQGV